jgi:hypothetical protein
MTSCTAISRVIYKKWNAFDVPPYRGVVDPIACRVLHKAMVAILAPRQSTCGGLPVEVATYIVEYLEFYDLLVAIPLCVTQWAPIAAVHAVGDSRLLQRARSDMRGVAQRDVKTRSFVARQALSRALRVLRGGPFRDPLSEEDEEEEEAHLICPDCGSHMNTNKCSKANVCEQCDPDWSCECPAEQTDRTRYRYRHPPSRLVSSLNALEFGIVYHQIATGTSVTMA